MDENQNKEVLLDRSDVIVKFTSSGGKGGQNVNRRSTCCILIHKPTGIIVRSEENRTQGKNEAAAWKRLQEKLNKINDSEFNSKIKTKRFDQIGYGARNNKKRTYRVQDGIVIDHVTNKKVKLKDVYKGNIGKLHV